MVATARSTDRPVTDARTDLVTMVLALWLMFGLFLDGYAHTNLIDELESFFTPWHAVFYSGFLATTAWVARLIYRNIGPERGWRDAVPAGYGITVVGLLLFALGGVGDGIWHTVFGVEAGIDALLSPTHFVLFFGGVLGLSTPVRTVRIRSRGELRGNDIAPLVLSLLLVTAALAFFSAYMWVPGQREVFAQAYDPSTGEGAGAVAFGIAGLLVSTLILMAPLVIATKWWRPPIGMTTLIWGLIGLGMTLSFDLAATTLVVGLAGGITGDVGIWLLRPGPNHPKRSLLLLWVTPMAAWGAFFLTLGPDLAWQPELWSGSIILSGLVSAGLGWLSLAKAEG